MRLSRVFEILGLSDAPEKEVSDATWRALEDAGWRGAHRLSARMVEEVPAFRGQVDDLIIHTVIGFAVSRRLPLEAIDELLDAGALGKAGKKGVPHALVAAANAHPSTIPALLAAGANIQRAPTALHLALIHPETKEEHIRAMVAAGADINAVAESSHSSVHGKTPLAIAVSRGHRDHIRLLLDLAASATHQSVLRALLTEAPVSESSALHIGGTGLARLLMDHGLDLDEAHCAPLLVQDGAQVHMSPDRAVAMHHILGVVRLSREMSSNLPVPASRPRARM